MHDSCKYLNCASERGSERENEYAKRIEMKECDKYMMTRRKHTLFFSSQSTDLSEWLRRMCHVGCLPRSVNVHWIAFDRRLACRNQLFHIGFCVRRERRKGETHARACIVMRMIVMLICVHFEALPVAVFHRTGLWVRMVNAYDL